LWVTNAAFFSEFIFCHKRLTDNTVVAFIIKLGITGCSSISAISARAKFWYKIIFELKFVKKISISETVIEY